MLENILSNKFVTIAGILAVPAAFLADTTGKSYAYFIAFFIVTALFAAAYFDERKKLRIYTKETLHLPLIFNISNPADPKTALNSLFTILNKNFPNHKNNLKKYLNIIEDDLIFRYDGDIFNEMRFIDFLKITKHDIKQLQKRTVKNVHYHIVYIGPIANAIALGTMLGTEGLTLYQYNKSTDSYQTAIDIKDRRFKENVEDFKIIKKEIIGEIEKEVTVAIELSSHKIAFDKLQKPIIYLKSSLGSTILKAEDFLRANQEIFSIINSLQQRCDRMILAYSIPTTVGFLLGMSIQNYWDIKLTQYTNGEYKSVIEHLNRIKYYF